MVRDVLFDHFLISATLLMLGGAGARLAREIHEQCAAGRAHQQLAKAAADATSS